MRWRSTAIIGRGGWGTQGAGGGVDMGGNSAVGPILMLAGLAMLLVGAAAWAGALSWFGRLPGDVSVERPGFSLYAPITSMIVVSLALTGAVALIRWFGRG